MKKGSATPYGVWESAIKKTQHHPKPSADARQRFQTKITRYKAQHRTLVYIDESGFAQSMPRTHGYAPKGQRCQGSHDWQAKGRINVIGALVDKHLVTAPLFETTINADVFQAWLRQDLLPKLPSSCVVIMDNAAFHKRSDCQQTLASAGHTLEYLPPYSPDLNPIEHKWAQAKALRRRRQCSVDELFIDDSI